MIQSIAAKSHKDEPVPVARGKNKNAVVEPKKELKELPLWPKLVERLFNLHTFVFDKPYQMEGMSQVSATP